VASVPQLSFEAQAAGEPLAACARHEPAGMGVEPDPREWHGTKLRSTLYYGQRSRGSCSVELLYHSEVLYLSEYTRRYAAQRPIDNDAVYSPKGGCGCGAYAAARVTATYRA
jgi:hypothetical protein